MESKTVAIYLSRKGFYGIIILIKGTYNYGFAKQIKGGALDEQIYHWR